ncbi:MAG TPA: HlyD family efflux transporter periplasmic adaptor subunit [Acidobacteriota bacterium]|nr:HlyD family efflux transporter periplasmic adaptor subunit [Acidobacteriota bacterium]
MPGYAKLRDDLVSSRMTVAGQTVYTLKDPVGGRYFRLREPEFWLVHQLDGRTEPERIASRFRERFQLNISAADVQAFVDQLEELLFLESSRSEQLVSRAGYRTSSGRSLAGRIFYLKLKAFSPGRLLDRLTALYRPLHRPGWFVVQGVVIVIGLAVLWANAGRFAVDPAGIYNVTSIAAIVLSIFILVTFHEFAHAVVCRYYGGQVREIGFLLMYFQPCFYCDISDAWLFEKKSHRLAVTIAGPYFQLVLMAAAVIIWRVATPGTAVSEVSRLVVIVSLVSYLFNFNPLIKLDGYYLLSDWLDIPNLRQKSFSYLGYLLKRGILGWPVESPGVTRRERRIFTLYAILSLAYTGFLITYILFLAGRFLLEKVGGTGLVLLLTILLFVFRHSVIGLGRGVVRHLAYMKRILRKPLRLASYVAVFAVVLVGSLAVPFPQRVSGDVIVRPIAEFTLSLSQAGLLETNLRFGGEKPESRSSFLQMTSNEMAVLDLAPLVQDGQRVRPGDTIALLTSNQITREITSAQAELDGLEGELALLQAPPKAEEVAEAAAGVTAAQAYHDQQLREYERVKQLVEKKLETAEKLEAAGAALDIARAEVANKTSRLRLLQSPPRPEEEAVLRHGIDKQKANLDFLTQQAEAQMVVTPIGGTVSTRADGNEILKVANHNTVELTVPVSDFDITLVRTGQSTAVKVRSYPQRMFVGRVIRISEEAEAGSDKSYFPVSVVLDNDDGLLRSGMSGYAKIEVGRASLAGLAARKLTSLLRVEFWSWW